MRTLYCLLILICSAFTMKVTASSTILHNQVQEAVMEYFSQLMDCPADDLRLTFTRLSVPDLDHGKTYRVRIVRNRNKLQLGQQTIWAEFLEQGKLVAKIPVSVRLERRTTVVRATTKIKRKELIGPEMLQTDEQFVDSQWPLIVKNADQIIGQAAKRVIRAGELLTLDLFEEAPIVYNGDQLTLHIRQGPVLITTDCIAKSDGRAGEYINVMTDYTSQPIRALIKEPGVVVFEREK